MSDFTDGMITVVEFSQTTGLSKDLIVKMIRIGTLIGTYEDDQWYVRSVELSSIDPNTLEKLIFEEKEEQKKKTSPSLEEPSNTGCLGVIGLGFFISIASTLSDVAIDKIGKTMRRSDFSATNYHYSSSDYPTYNVTNSEKTPAMDYFGYHNSNKKIEFSNNRNKLINEHDLIGSNHDFSNSTFDELDAKEIVYLAEQKNYSVNHFIIIPENRSIYKNIFTRNSNEKEINRIKEIKSSLDEINNAHIAKPDDGQMQIEEFIRKSDSEYLTFTGHNNNGDLILPNGDKIQLNNISEWCLEFKKRCVFLSCKSKKYLHSKKSIGIDSDLTYSDASELIKKINNKSQLTDDNEISYLEFSVYISEELNKKLSTVQFKSRAVFYVKRGGKLAGIGGISYKTNDYLNDKK